MKCKDLDSARSFKKPLDSARGWYAALCAAPVGAAHKANKLVLSVVEGRPIHYKIERSRDLYDLRPYSIILHARLISIAHECRNGHGSYALGNRRDITTLRSHFIKLHVTLNCISAFLAGIRHS